MSDCELCERCTWEKLGDLKNQIIHPNSYKSYKSWLKKIKLKMKLNESGLKTCAILIKNNWAVFKFRVSNHLLNLNIQDQNLQFIH